MELTPIVIESTPLGERVYDIYSRLLKDRIIFINSPINKKIASIVIAQLLFLQKENPDEEIQMYINSEGGEVTAGLAIYDTMNLISNKISTVCIGDALSMAAILLSNGAKGQRYALPHSRIMIHQGYATTHGTPTDIHIEFKEIIKYKNIIIDILHKNTNQPKEKIIKDIDRDYYMTPKEACEYGIIDEIL